MSKRLTPEELEAVLVELERGMGLVEERDPYGADADLEAVDKTRSHIAALEAEIRELREANSRLHLHVHEVELSRSDLWEEIDTLKQELRCKI
jgi:FtsZ-binding cell division protein ZapB